VAVACPARSRSRTRSSRPSTPATPTSRSSARSSPTRPPGTSSPPRSAAATRPTSWDRSASAVEAFHGEWLDLTDLIAANNYDLTQYAEGTVDFYNVGGEGQIGLPFAVYPTILFYQKEMFAEAGLNEPPHAYGDQQGDARRHDGRLGLRRDRRDREGS
jgi:hypothetical protein